MRLGPVQVLATVAAAVLGGTLVGLAVAPLYDLRRDVILAGGTVAFFVVRPFMADVVALAFLLLPVLYVVRMLATVPTDFRATWRRPTGYPYCHGQPRAPRAPS